MSNAAPEPEGAPGATCPACGEALVDASARPHPALVNASAPPTTACPACGQAPANDTARTRPWSLR